MVRKIKQLLLFLLISLLFNNSTIAQEIIWKAGFNSFFDNHEYLHNPWSSSVTMFGARAFAEMGFAIDNENEFNVGLDYLHEYGSKTSDDKVKPIIYFHHLTKKSNIYIGAFPSRELIQMPKVLLNDTIQYYRPNVEGIYLNFSNSWGSQKLWFDWTSKQTLEDRETFLVGITGEAHNNLFFGRYDFLLYHYANTGAPGPNDLRDNGGLVASLGINLSPFTDLDSLSFNTGITGSYDRLREAYDLRYYYGSLSELFIQYRQFGLRSTLYFGDGQVQMLGDQLYASSTYNRNDLIWNFFNKGRLNGFVEASVHIFPNHIINYSQKFGVYVDISGRKNLK